jgi:hypothetical protein
MAITIQPLGNQPNLRVSGDVEAILSIPQGDLEADDGRSYYIALSDGSLIRATASEDPQYEVVIEGAGLIELDAAERSLTVGWGIEWVNVAGNANGTAVAQRSVQSLPLFRPSIGRVAVAQGDEGPPWGDDEIPW